MRLVPIKKINEAKSVNIDNYRDFTQDEIDKLHHFGVRPREDLLDITIQGITLSSGYKEVKFYKAKEKFGAVAVSGMKPNDKYDFITEKIDEIVEDCQSVEFLEALNGEIMAIANKDGKKLMFDTSSKPSFTAEEESMLKIYKTKKQVHGKIVDGIVIAKKNSNGLSAYLDGKKIDEKLVKELIRGDEKNAR